MSENNKFGRTKYDWISENPKKSFSIFITVIILLTIVGIIVVVLQIPVKYGDFEVGGRKTKTDTITIIKHDTVVVTKVKYITIRKSNETDKKDMANINVTSNQQQGGQTAAQINNNNK